MESFTNNFESSHGFEVKLLDLGSIKKVQEIPQLAYAVDQNNFNILVGKSGHAKMMQGKDKHEFEGGWIFPKQEKISFYSGTLGEVSSNREEIVNAISNALKLHLRIADN